MVSEYSTALENLLDKTDLFSREEWAEFSGVDTEVVNRWISESELPRPHHLSMIYTALNESSGINKGPLIAFEEMARAPSMEVSAIYGELMLPTVWDYMKRPAFCELSSKLAKLDDAGKKDLLRSIYLS